MVHTEDGKIYPLGPFSHDGKLCSVLEKSRSFASDLHERFYCADPKDVAVELYEKLYSDHYLNELKNPRQIDSFEKARYKAIFGEEPEDEAEMTYEKRLAANMRIKYLPICELPNVDFIKKGYVLASQVTPENWDGDFYPILDPHVYAEKLKTSIFAKKCKSDDESDEDEYDITDFIYHEWVDPNCEEYETFIIRQMLDAFNEYDLKGERLIIETEG